MSAIEDLGIQAAGQAVSGGMGLILGGINDKRQLRQQGKLQEQQIKGQKEMSDYNFGKQLDMWNATNYEAQVKHMNAAGLNPGLLYGMGGGGGTTTGSGGGSVQGASAPQGGHEVQDMIGMGIQTQLLEAQKEVLESQAKKNNAEANKTAGIDTTVATSQNESILQGVDNLRQDFELKKLEVTLKNITNYEQQASQQDRLDYIEYNTKIALRQLNILGNDNKISNETVTANIQKIKAESIGAVLENILTQSKIQLTNEQKQQVRLQGKKLAAELGTLDMQQSNDNIELSIKNQLKEWTTDPNKEAIQEAVHAIGGIIKHSK